MAAGEVGPPVPTAAAHTHSPANVPSREAVWVHEVLRRLEDRSKPLLASLLFDVERWEFGEAEVRIRLADNGIAKALPDADRRLLDQLVAEVVGRKVQVQLVGDWKGGTSGRRAQPENALGSPGGPVEEQVRADPEVMEFETLFGKRVTGIRRWGE